MAVLIIENVGRYWDLVCRCCFSFPLHISIFFSTTPYSLLYYRYRRYYPPMCVVSAGIGEIPIGGSRVTADGLNLIFGVNFVGHFALTMELLPLIKATPSAR